MIDRGDRSASLPHHLTLTAQVFWMTTPACSDLIFSRDRHKFTQFQSLYSLTSTETKHSRSAWRKAEEPERRAIQAFNQAIALSQGFDPAFLRNFSPD